MDNIKKSLILLGLTTKEIKFFEASFKLGPATINDVAKAAKLQRSTAYLLAQELIAKGFLDEDLKDYKKLICAIDPQKLIKMVASRQRILRRQELELEDELPNLQALYQASDFRPKVKVYEGNSGLLRVWHDILSTKNEILVWTNQQTDSIVFGPEKHFNFISERVKKQIPARVLALDNKEGRELKSLDKENLRQTKILPKDVLFTAETYVYDNKIAILDYNKDIIGVIIESEPITNSYRAIFEMNWKAFN